MSTARTVLDADNVGGTDRVRSRAMERLYLVVVAAAVRPGAHIVGRTYVIWGVGKAVVRRGWLHCRRSFNRQEAAGGSFRQPFHGFPSGVRYARRQLDIDRGWLAGFALVAATMAPKPATEQLPGVRSRSIYPCVGATDRSPPEPGALRNAKNSPVCRCLQLGQYLFRTGTSLW